MSLPEEVTCPRTICWQDYPFLYWTGFVFLLKISWTYLCGSISALSVLLCWSVRPPQGLAPPHTVSSSWAASRAFDEAIPATALFFSHFSHFKTCAFPYNFKSHYVYKTRHWDFDRNCVKHKDQWEREELAPSSREVFRSLNISLGLLGILSSAVLKCSVRRSCTGFSQGLLKWST